jgi:hypothetical protein
MAQMETETLKNLVSLLMSEARHEIAKLEMPESTWDALNDHIYTFETKLIGIYRAVGGDK